MGWRLINTDLADPYYVTAADEAITIHREKNQVPNTLHFYRRNQPTISLGRSRKIQNDVNTDYCTNHNITLLRRTTGGGTIYTDPGCLIYSLIFNKKDAPFTSLQDTFKHICFSLITALYALQIPTQYKPPNDVLLNGKKISGAGLIKKNNTILIHGTLLISTNLTTMHHSLNHKPTKTPVTTLTQQLPDPPPIPDIQHNITNQISQLFKTYLSPSTLTLEEKALIAKLIQTRYQQQNWTYKR
jgi:lipoate-protein ligase A